MTMAEFMVNRIEKAGQTSTEAAQEKYRQYFVYTKIYVKLYKSQVDEILIADGHEDYIVEE